MDTSIKEPLSADVVKQVFIHNLNRIYFGKDYLDKHFDHWIGNVSFPSLKLALGEVWDDVKNQISRMLKIYTLLDETPSDKSCNPIKSMIRDTFLTSEELSLTIITDTDIIAYVRMLEHINMSAYNMLKILSSKLKNAEVEQLLIECFDESVDDDHLFTLIAKEYLLID